MQNVCVRYTCSLEGVRERVESTQSSSESRSMCDQRLTEIFDSSFSSHMLAAGRVSRSFATFFVIYDFFIFCFFVLFLVLVRLLPYLFCFSSFFLSFILPPFSLSSPFFLSRSSFASSLFLHSFHTQPYSDRRLLHSTTFLIHTSP